MEFPLRNTIEIIRLAGLDSKNINKTSIVSYVNAKPSYSFPPHLMSGVQCQHIKVKENDNAELEEAVEDGCQVMIQRTAGSGFPVLDIVTITVSRSSVCSGQGCSTNPGLQLQWKREERGDLSGGVVEAVEEGGGEESSCH